MMIYVDDVMQCYCYAKKDYFKYIFFLKEADLARNHLFIAIVIPDMFTWNIKIRKLKI